MVIYMNYSNQRQKISVLKFIADNLETIEYSRRNKLEILYKNIFWTKISLILHNMR